MTAAATKTWRPRNGTPEGECPSCGCSHPLNEDGVCNHCFLCARPKRVRAAKAVVEQAPEPGVRTRDPRLPAAGTVLTRGSARVTVLVAGFEYKGDVYKSISAVGRLITGRSCNGYEYFGLTGGGK